MRTSLDYRDGFLCVLIENRIEPMKWFPVSRVDYAEVQTLLGRTARGRRRQRRRQPGRCNLDHGARLEDSHKTNTEYILTPTDISWFMGHYLRTDADRRGPLASPSFAASFNGLPPALIITAEFDPLRDEAEYYGQKLREAGVHVQVSRYEGMVHGFISMNDMIDKGKDGIAEAAATLKKAFGRG